MKKIVIAAILSLTIASCVSPALALSLKLDKAKDEDLPALITQIEKEMIDRGLVKSAKVPAGRFEVGVDLPAGKYEMTEQEAGTIAGPLIIIYKDNNPDLNVNAQNSIVYDRMEPGKSFVVDLHDGNVLDVDKPVILTVFTGIRFE